MKEEESMMKWKPNESGDGRNGDKCQCAEVSHKMEVVR